MWYCRNGEATEICYMTPGLWKSRRPQRAPSRATRNSMQIFMFFQFKISPWRPRCVNYQSPSSSSSQQFTAFLRWNVLDYWLVACRPLRCIKLRWGRQQKKHNKNLQRRKQQTAPSRRRHYLLSNYLSYILTHLTLRWLMSYIYGAPILDVSRSHTTTQHSR